MSFDVVLHTVNVTGPGNLVVQDTTEPAIISGSMISFDGGQTFEPFTFLGQGNFRGDGQSGEFIQVGDQVFAYNSDDPTGTLPTGNWMITQDDLDPTNPPCFVAGTLIDTPSGPCPVEDLSPGDLVLGEDGQALEVMWVGHRTLPAQALRQNPKFRPVCIRENALGAGVPNRDLWVSPQHRIVIEGWRAELLFGEPMVFSAAVHLINDDTIRQSPVDDPVTYYHVACAKHAILTSHGLRSESLFLGDQVLRSFGRADVEELCALFPELRSPVLSGETRLRCLKRPEVQALQALKA